MTATPTHRATVLLLGLGNLLLSWPAPAHAGTAPVISARDCLDCHARKAGVEGDPGLLVDTDALKRSVHGGKVTCQECHVGVGLDVRTEHADARKPVACDRCHGPHPSRVPEAFRGRADSIHQRPREHGSGRVPTCQYCHGGHEVLAPTSPDSKVNREHIRETCGTCHAHQDTPRSKAAPQTAVEFDLSIHGQARNKRGLPAATCIDCHLPHHPGHPASTHPIQKQDIPALCGHCHSEIEREYRETIHGRDLVAGNPDVPSCVDCHGEHTIRAPEDTESNVNPAHVVQTCTRCHENKQLQRKYGLPADRINSYQKSYHGISNRFGDIRAANCATCHTAHHILPKSDPRSSVYPANLKRTCGKSGCHAGATERFALGPVHLAPSPESESFVYWAGCVYKSLVLVLVAFFCLSIVLDLFKRATLWLTRGGEGK